MSKNTVSIRLEDSAIGALDHFAKSLPSSRSRLVEKIVTLFLEQDHLLQERALGNALRSGKSGQHQ